MNILFATSNPHKIAEVEAILAPLGIHVTGLDALDAVPDEPIEDGDSFEANARIKAVYYAQHTGRSCLADDSGLEVDALNGAPGIHSARYASDEVEHFFDLPRAERDAANNRKLLRQLSDIPQSQRAARFVCAMCLADPEGNVIATSRGTFPGVVTGNPAGDNGFGYDPLLYLPDVNCTSAQLSSRDKNARSHRGDAARELAEKLRALQPR